MYNSVVSVEDEFEYGFRPFTPYYLEEFLANQLDNTPKPQSVTINAALLLLDMSGFTSLSQQFSSHGNIGIESLSGHINRLFSSVIAAIYKAGGDVIKFMGDALLIMFSKHRDKELVNYNSSNYSSPTLTDLSLRAVRCALSIHSEFDYFPAMEGLVLRLHSGIAAGSIQAVNVGGISDRFEFLLLGNALEELGYAMNCAGKGEIAIIERDFKPLQQYGLRAASAVINNNRSIPIVIIQQPSHKASSSNFNKTSTNSNSATSSLGKSLLSFMTSVNSTSSNVASNSKTAALESLTTISPIFPFHRPSRLPSNDISLHSYIPTAVFSRIAEGHSAMLAEFRRVTTVFILLPDKIAQRLDDLQSAFTSVQEITSRYRGDIRQLVRDDKGLVCILLFGLFSDSTNPLRAVRAALEIYKLMQADQLPVKIGISTGSVFVGLIGSEHRAEYTAIGDKVNVSARLMNAVSSSGGILTDEETKNSCLTSTKVKNLHFLSLKPIQLKGRQELTPIFRPEEVSNIQITSANSDIKSNSYSHSPSVLSPLPSLSTNTFALTLPAVRGSNSFLAIPSRTSRRSSVNAEHTYRASNASAMAGRKREVAVISAKLSKIYSKFKGANGSLSAAAPLEISPYSDHFVYIESVAGMGKSCLLEAISKQISENQFLLLHAGSPIDENSVSAPYFAFRNIIHSILEQLYILHSKANNITVPQRQRSGSRRNSSIVSINLNVKARETDSFLYNLDCLGLSNELKRSNLFGLLSDINPLIQFSSRPATPAPNLISTLHHVPSAVSINSILSVVTANSALRRSSLSNNSNGSISAGLSDSHENVPGKDIELMDRSAGPRLRMSNILNNRRHQRNQNVIIGVNNHTILEGSSISNSATSQVGSLSALNNATATSQSENFFTQSRSSFDGPQHSKIFPSTALFAHQNSLSGGSSNNTNAMRSNSADLFTAVVNRRLTRTSFSNRLPGSTLPTIVSPRITPGNAANLLSDNQLTSGSLVAEESLDDPFSTSDRTPKTGAALHIAKASQEKDYPFIADRQNSEYPLFAPIRSDSFSHDLNYYTNLSGRNSRLNSQLESEQHGTDIEADSVESYDAMLENYHAYRGQRFSLAATHDNGANNANNSNSGTNGSIAAIPAEAASDGLSDAFYNILRSRASAVHSKYNKGKRHSFSGTTTNNKEPGAQPRRSSLSQNNLANAGPLNFDSLLFSDLQNTNATSTESLQPRNVAQVANLNYVRRSASDSPDLSAHKRSFSGAADSNKYSQSAPILTGNERQEAIHNLVLQLINHLSTVSGKGVCLMFDDCHELDALSIQLICYLLHNNTSTAGLVQIMSARSSNPPCQMHMQLEEIAAETRQQFDLTAAPSAWSPSRVARGMSTMAALLPPSANNVSPLLAAAAATTPIASNSNLLSMADTARRYVRSSIVVAPAHNPEGPLLIDLVGLNESETHELLTNLLQVNEVNREVSSFIYSKSGGSPLFALELCMQLLSNKFLHIAENQLEFASTADAVRSLPIPTDLKEMLGSRVDSLGGALQLLIKICAVFGVEIFAPAIKYIYPYNFNPNLLSHHSRNHSGNSSSNTPSLNTATNTSSTVLSPLMIALTATTNSQFSNNDVTLTPSMQTLALNTDQAQPQPSPFLSSLGTSHSSELSKKYDETSIDIHDAQFIETGLANLCDLGFLKEYNAEDSSAKAKVNEDLSGCFYYFSHSLTRDICYDRLTYSYRSLFHHKIADYFEHFTAENPQQIGYFLSKISFHYYSAAASHNRSLQTKQADAALLYKALFYLNLTVSEQIKINANLEARENLVKALELLDLLSVAQRSAIEIAEIEFVLLNSYRSVNNILSGVEHSNSIVLKLCELVECLHNESAALFYSLRAHFYAIQNLPPKPGKMKFLSVLLEFLAKQAERLTEVEEQCQFESYCMYSLYYTMQGRYLSSQTFSNQVRQFYKVNQLNLQHSLLNPATSSRIFACLSYAGSGKISEAQLTASEATELASTVIDSNPLLLASAYCHRVVINLLFGYIDHRLIETALELVKRNNLQSLEFYLKILNWANSVLILADNTEQIKLITHALWQHLTTPVTAEGLSKISVNRSSTAGASTSSMNLLPTTPKVSIYWAFAVCCCLQRSHEYEKGLLYTQQWIEEAHEENLFFSECHRYRGEFHLQSLLFSSHLAQSFDDNVEKLIGSYIPSVFLLCALCGIGLELDDLNNSSGQKAFSIDLSFPIIVSLQSASPSIPVFTACYQAFTESLSLAQAQQSELFEFRSLISLLALCMSCRIAKLDWANIVGNNTLQSKPNVDQKPANPVNSAGSSQGNSPNINNSNASASVSPILQHLRDTNASNANNSTSPHSFTAAPLSPAQFPVRPDFALSNLAVSIPSTPSLVDTDNSLELQLINYRLRLQQLLNSFESRYGANCLSDCTAARQLCSLFDDI
jgi:class 3 adenylate cyclase